MGFRDFEAVDGKFFLNGNDFYLRGVLDQDFYADTLYTVPSKVLLERSFRTLKEMGFNTLRCHVKAPDPIYMETADAVGLIVWQDAPYIDRWESGSAKKLEETIFSVLERDSRHPSLCLYALINESWGLHMADPSQIEWLKALFGKVKETYPGLCLVDNSPCTGNYHVITDMNDYHFYTSMLDRAFVWQTFLDAWHERPSMSFLPSYERNETGQPMVLSEFGNWSLGSPDWFLVDGKDLPFWARHRFIDSDAVMVTGSYERFKNSELYREFSLEEFIRLTRNSQTMNLELSIRSMQEKPKIRGYVVTEFCDTFWETNGLFDFHHLPKHEPKEIAFWNKRKPCTVSLLRHHYLTGEPLEAECTLLERNENPLSLILLTEEGKEIDRRNVFKKRNRQQRVSFTLPTLSEGVYRSKIALSGDSSNGWHVSFSITNPVNTCLPLDDTLTEEIVEEVRNGAVRFLRLSENDGEFACCGYQATVRKREGQLSGDWVSGFVWAGKLLRKFFPEGGIVECHRILFEHAPLLDSTGWQKREIGVTYGWFGAFFGFMERIDIGKGHLWVTTLQGSPDHPLLQAIMKCVVSETKKSLRNKDD
jgi:hypothetical protein